MKKPRKLSLVKFAPENMTPEMKAKYPFKEGQVYIFIGEVVNMPGHCVIAEHPSGTIFSGYHTENFIELDKDEV